MCKLFGNPTIITSRISITHFLGIYTASAAYSPSLLTRQPTLETSQQGNLMLPCAVYHCYKPASDHLSYWVRYPALLIPSTKVFLQRCCFVVQSLCPPVCLLAYVLLGPPTVEDAQSIS